MTRPTDGRPPAESTAAASGGTRADRRASKTEPSRRAPLWLRLVAWIVAIPLGLMLVVYPARKAGYLSSQRLLDVLIGKDVDRYLPLAVVVILWALVTALIVQLVVEGGAALMRRRQRKALAGERAAT